MSKETTFFSEKSVQVTNSRFIIPGETYAMSGIISVKSSKTDKSEPLSIKLRLLGLLFGWFFCGLTSFTFYLSHQSFLGSLILVFICYLSWLFLFGDLKSPIYSVTLRTSSGEIKALESSELQFIDKVTEAINQAIVARG